ncbi:hypothetical protein BH11MYX1_BH11MYX1_46220 [soil metagenome]
MTYLVATTLLVAACGTSGSAPAEVSGCNAELSGNYLESTWSTKNCPTLAAGVGATQGDTLLEFQVPSRTLRGAYAITVDLGRAPTPGAYNSGTTDLWSATGTRAVGTGACVFIASNNSTPSGDFVLDLSTIDHTTSHGTLALRMFVLPRAADDGAQTDCGAGTTEQLQLRF